MNKDMEVCNEKVRAYYNSEGKLIQYPTIKQMKIIVLWEIAEKFELGKKYTEKEVNEIIKESIAFSDVRLIRRDLYEYMFIDKLRDSSVYWLESDWREMYGEYIKKL